MAVGDNAHNHGMNPVASAQNQLKLVPVGNLF